MASVPPLDASTTDSGSDEDATVADSRPPTPDAGADGGACGELRRWPLPAGLIGFPCAIDGADGFAALPYYSDSSRDAGVSPGLGVFDEQGNFSPRIDLARTPFSAYAAQPLPTAQANLFMLRTLKAGERGASFAVAIHCFSRFLSNCGDWVIMNDRPAFVAPAGSVLNGFAPRFDLDSDGSAVIAAHHSRATSCSSWIETSDELERGKHLPVSPCRPPRWTEAGALSSLAASAAPEASDIGWTSST